MTNLPTLDEVLAELDRREYAHWLKRHQPPGFGLPRHIAYLCEVAQRVIDGDLKRVCISTPPGHGKSATITHSLPVWWGQHRANEKILVTGYNQTFAERDLSEPARAMAAEMGLLLKADSALEDWKFKNGSRLVAKGVGVTPTGINPITLAVIDDPIKDPAQAESQTFRDNLWRWWTGGIVQRFWPETRCIVICTRWHEDDLIGRLQASPDADEWTFINLPAIALEGDVLGRAPGEALWPEKKPLEFLEGLRTMMGAARFEALFQGNPTPFEGRLFKVGMIGIEDAEPPPGAVLVGYGDIAATEGAGDYTAFAWCWFHAGRYFLRVRRVQVGPKGLREFFARQMEVYQGRAQSVWLPQDPGGTGKAYVEDLKWALAMHPVRSETQTGSKELRAGPLAARVEAGDVVVLPGPDTADFIEELRQFPGGKHDDMVDAASGAFNKVAALVASNSSTPMSFGGIGQAGQGPIVFGG